MLKEKANHIRQEIIRVAVKNKAGHIASSLSCVDLLVALYYDVMANEDRLIFSKAHGCYGIYAILVDKGIIPREKWENFDLPGCLERMPEYGIEAGCGALGHGLPMATGLAFGLKLQKKKGFVFCLCGDGELQEGTTWEAVQFAFKHSLNNLIIIVDDNRLQAMDFRINILDGLEDDPVRRFEGFRLFPWQCEGHNVEIISRILQWFKTSTEIKPKVLYAKTIKGYGLKCAENVPKWHFRIPSGEELSQGNN